MRKTIIAFFAILLSAQMAVASDYMALLDRIDVALKSRDWTLSERLLKEALETEPANPNNYLLLSNLGTVCRNQGKLDDALENYDMALTVAPKSTTILHNRAALLMEMDSTKRALADYQKLLDINPSDSEARASVGLIALEVGDMALAEESFQKCLDANSSDMDARRGMALLRRLNGDYDKAIALYDGIINDENRVSNYLNRAECYMAVSRFQEAQQDLMEAQKLDPQSSDLFLLKARLAQLQFRFDDACDYAKEALRLGCDKELAAPYMVKKEK